MNAAINVVSRVLLASLFVIAGVGKLGAGYAGTQGYMESMGVPGFLLPLVILLEIGGGLALVAGFQTRWIALILAGFSIVTGFLFHFHPGDAMQMTNFLKNLSIAGGLLLLVQHGASYPSIDKRQAD
ncbi:DoxX family protein [Pokkaliibacter sp. MBI-7]|uniref:DoxX family protein n=1 Tax=Pokkaliibacter sp. MBI-7 TaxID=3040600 RepID=UPI00244A8711|nr:DoxX family protein [Pokkaliibacter sp. MBI-7]MDH2436164.1 DoxX family protein [Pokkaliibacter sp. MBI-7]